MDYSNLNRLKDKREQATNAAQVAMLSDAIEEEENRIREAEAQAAASEKETISIL